MPIRFSTELDKTNEMLTLTQNLVDGVFTLYLIIISIVMLVRGKKWWSQKDAGSIVKLAKRKTKFFIGMLAALGILVLFACVSPFFGVSSTTHIGTLFSQFTSSHSPNSPSSSSTSLPALPHPLSVLFPPSLSLSLLTLPLTSSPSSYFPISDEHDMECDLLHDLSPWPPLHPKQYPSK